MNKIEFKKEIISDLKNWNLLLDTIKKTVDIVLEDKSIDLRKQVLEECSKYNKDVILTIEKVLEATNYIFNEVKNMRSWIEKNRKSIISICEAIENIANNYYFLEYKKN